MGSAMTTIRLRFIHSYVDRIGKPRHYFRRKGQPKITLPGEPGSTEFMEAYRVALQGSPAPVQRQARTFAPGTVDALVTQFYGSAQFEALRPNSRRAYRGILERFRKGNGDKPVALMNREHVKRMIAERASTPSAANSFLALMNNLMTFAMDEGYRDDNPCSRIKRLKTRRGGFHTWTDEEIAKFEAHWPIGTKARLAFALHLYTGQRRSDVIKMTWGQIADGKIRVTQVKTGTALRIRIHPELQTVLDAAPREHVAILTTDAGKTMHPNSYVVWLRKRIDEAGLPTECASHGLRKAAARRLAEAGCSALEIASVTGHASLKEVERYTREADRERMADSAIGRLATIGKKP